MIEEEKPLIDFAPLNDLIEEEASLFVTEATNLLTQTILELESDVENLINVIKQTSSME